MKSLFLALAFAAVASAQDGSIYDGCGMMKNCLGGIPMDDSDCVANQVMEMDCQLISKLQ